MVYGRVVEALERLVDHEDLGVGNEGPGQGEELPLGLGEDLVPAVDVLSQE